MKSSSSTAKRGSNSPTQKPEGSFTTSKEAPRHGVMMLREAVVDPSEFKAARRPVGQSDPLGAFR